MAGSSKQFVCLPSVRKNTWLLWSKRAGTVFLREYTVDLCRIVKKLALQDAEVLLALPTSRVETNACSNTIRANEASFWFLLNNSLNIRDGFVTADDKDKLQAAFRLQCLKPLLDGETKQLETLFAMWLSLFTKIKEEQRAIAQDFRTPLGWVMILQRRFERWFRSKFLWFGCSVCLRKSS